MEVLELEWAHFDSRFNQIGQHTPAVNLLDEFPDFFIYAFATDFLQFHFKFYFIFLAATGNEYEPGAPALSLSFVIFVQ